MMLPTARAARGLPASAATSPYEATNPGGIRLTTESTRGANRSGVAFFTQKPILMPPPAWSPPAWSVTLLPAAGLSVAVARA